MSFYTEGLKNKIEAWEQTLEFVNTEINIKKSLCRGPN